MSKSEIYEHQFKVARPSSGLCHYHFTSGVPYLSGCVSTRHGLVDVNSWSGHTSLHFIAGSTSYYRRFEKGFTERYLVTLASRFAKEKGSRCT